MHLPDTNPYIPSAFALCCDSPTSEDGIDGIAKKSLYPILLQRSAYGVKYDQSVRLATAGNINANSNFKIPTSNSFTTWFKMDSNWKVPKVILNCAIISPECSFSPLDVVLTELLCDFIDEKLNLDTYYAPIAGLNYSIAAQSHLNTKVTRLTAGIIVDVYGFNHKAISLMEKILSEFRMFANEFKNPLVSPAKIASDKALYRRVLKKLQIKYNATLFNGGIQINRRHMGMILQEGQYSILDILDVLGYKSNKTTTEEEDDSEPLGMTFEDLQAFAARLFRLGSISVETTANPPNLAVPGAGDGAAGDGAGAQPNALQRIALAHPFVNTSGNFRLELYMYGNLSSDQAIEASDGIRRILSNDDNCFIVSAAQQPSNTASTAASPQDATQTINAPSRQVTTTTTTTSTTATATIKKVISLSASLERPRRGVTVDLTNLSLSNRTIVTRTHVKYYNPDEKNSVLENVYLFGNGVDYRSSSNKDVIRREAIAELMSQLVSEQFFDVLRSKEQLGYVCYFTVYKNLNRVGICTIIQSSHTSPPAINRRVELFLKNFFNDTLAIMPEETFELFKKSTIDNLIEKPKNLIEEGYNAIAEIQNQQVIEQYICLLVEKIKTRIYIYNYHTIFILFMIYGAFFFHLNSYRYCSIAKCFYLRL